MLLQVLSIIILQKESKKAIFRILVQLTQEFLVTLLINRKKGYGIRLNTAYEMNDWSFGTFLNYWKIGDSERNYYADGTTVYGVYEPKNVTTEVGLQVKYRF